MKITEVYFDTKSIFLTQQQCRKDFGRNNVLMEGQFNIWWPNFRRRKVWQIPTNATSAMNATSVADAYKCQHRSLFGIIPENIQNLWEHHEESPTKSTNCLSQETGISRTSVVRILHDDLKPFPYKIQILQRQIDQNKAERETFCEDISQRIENDPGLLDMNNLNNVNHCGLFVASATLPVSRNLATKC